MTKTILLATAALTLVAAAPQDTQTLPGLGNFTLPPSPSAPTPTPTPVGPAITLPTLAPAPAAIPAPRASPSPRAAPSPRATPTPRATPSPRASETPRPTASPPPAASPSPLPIPSASAVAPVPVSTPTPTVAPAPAPSSSGGAALWRILGIVALLVLLGGAALWWKRRRDAAPEKPVKPKRPAAPRPKPAAKPSAPPPAPAKPTDSLSEAPSFWTPSKPAHLPEPAAPVAPPAPVPEPLLAVEPVSTLPPPPARPRIEIGIAPRRAGLNLLSATAEVEVLLRNEGGAPATNIALDVRLLNAQSAQDAELGALFAAAMGKSAVPPFEIAPGEEQTVRAVAVLPRDAIVPLIAANRPMFVPIVTVDVRYDRGDGGRGQSAAAFMIGVVRDGNDKLAPFWLDTPARMFDTIAARPHAFSVRS